jgi:general secretion pathway protein D
MKMCKSKYAIVFFQAMILLIAIIVQPGCSSPSVFQKQGIEMYRTGDYDKAVEYFEKAFKDKPNSDLRVLLFRAKLNSYYYHLAQARMLKDSNKKEEAVKEYKAALSIFPDNKKLKEELETYATGKVEKPAPFITSIKAPVTLKVDPNEKMNLKLRNTPITKIFGAVGKSCGINFVFDKDFRDFPYTMEVESSGFYEILGQLCMVAGADYRVLDRGSVLIFPDNSFKKRTFGLRGLKVFYLSNIKAEDAKKLVMTVFREQQLLIQEDTNLNTLIVRGDLQSLIEVERFLNSTDKRKSEVILDVQILEMTQSLIEALGVSYGADASGNLSTVTGGTYTTGETTSTLNSTVKFKDLSKTSFFLTIPSAALSFLETDDKNRIIAKPNLRGVDGEEIKFMVGDEVPVPQTTFQMQAAGGVANQPVTSYQYKNVGVEVKITPYIHKDNEVTLKLKLTINSVSGTQNGFPIFGKRELENIIRLKEGETNIIGGFIRDEVGGGMKGIPALSRIPILGQLFGASGKTHKQTDLVFSITPQVIRRVDITQDNEDPIWSNTQTFGPGAQEAPSVLQQSEAREPSGESISIVPPKRRVPMNTDQYFTIRVNTAAPIISLAFSGSVSGPKAVIDELKTDFFGNRNVQVLKNFSGTSFDIGLSIPDDRGGIGLVGQLKVKFQERGNYTISFGGVTAQTKDRKAVDLTASPAEIEVY